MNHRYKKVVEDMLTIADIKIESSRPWDIQVKDERMYKQVLGKGSIGLGEAYMEGWWDSPQLDEFFYKVLSAGLRENKI